jgi:hypothetical protein
MMAGTNTIRTTVASRKIADARPIPKSGDRERDRPQFVEQSLAIGPPPSNRARHKTLALDRGTFYTSTTRQKPGCDTQPYGGGRKLVHGMHVGAIVSVVLLAATSALVAFVLRVPPRPTTPPADVDLAMASA